MQNLIFVLSLVPHKFSPGPNSIQIWATSALTLHSCCPTPKNSLISASLESGTTMSPAHQPVCCRNLAWCECHKMWWMWQGMYEITNKIDSPHTNLNLTSFFLLSHFLLFKRLPCLLALRLTTIAKKTKSVINGKGSQTTTSRPQACCLASTPTSLKPSYKSFTRMSNV